MILEKVKAFRKKEEPKTITGAINQHTRVKKWTEGIKAFAFSSLAIVSITFTLSEFEGEAKEDHVAIIPLNGAIEAGSRETDGWQVSRTIREAIKDEHVKAIVIEANSGGGSPSDAEHIYKTIMNYRNSETVAEDGRVLVKPFLDMDKEIEYERKPIYVVIRSTCASACYYIASAADEIYATNSSLVGSIGVRLDSWNFQEVIKRVGVGKRTFHAGEHKALLDPFKTITSEEQQFVQHNLLDKLHGQFIQAVKEGRNGKLVDNPEIFSGLVWTGEEAVELGLTDGVLTPTELEDLIEQRHGITEYSYHGGKKFKLSNILSMDANSLMDMLGASIYHAFSSDVKNSTNHLGVK